MSEVRKTKEARTPTPTAVEHSRTIGIAVMLFLGAFCQLGCERGRVPPEVQRDLDKAAAEAATKAEEGGKKAVEVIQREMPDAKKRLANAERFMAKIREDGSGERLDISKLPDPKYFQAKKPEEGDLTNKIPTAMRECAQEGDPRDFYEIMRAARDGWEREKDPEKKLDALIDAARDKAAEKLVAVPVDRLKCIAQKVLLAP